VDLTPEPEESSPYASQTPAPLVTGFPLWRLNNVLDRQNAEARSEFRSGRHSLEEMPGPSESQCQGPMPRQPMVLSSADILARGFGCQLPVHFRHRSGLATYRIANQWLARSLPAMLSISRQWQSCRWCRVLHTAPIIISSCQHSGFRINAVRAIRHPPVGRNRKAHA
jgi:hypothetical protein